MKYPFRVYQTRGEDHVFWVAEIPTLKGCIGQGDTIEAALAELEENEMIWLETAEEFGIEVPEIPVELFAEYSGKFTARVAPYVHQQAAELAKKQGISLNQYVNDAIVAQNNRLITLNYVTPEMTRAVRAFKEMLSGTSESRSKTKETISARFFGNNSPYLVN